MTNVSQQRAFATTVGRWLLAITAITTAVVFAGAAQAHATNHVTTVERYVPKGCRIGASVFEHHGSARHISYDDNGRCPKIRMEAHRRCWGRNYLYIVGPTRLNLLDRQWARCDGIMTKTIAYDSKDRWLGSVEAWAK